MEAHWKHFPHEADMGVRGGNLHRLQGARRVAFRRLVKRPDLQNGHAGDAVREAQHVEPL